MLEPIDIGIRVSSVWRYEQAPHVLGAPSGPHCFVYVSYSLFSSSAAIACNYQLLPARAFVICEIASRVTGPRKERKEAQSKRAEVESRRGGFRVREPRIERQGAIARARELQTQT